MGLQEIKPDKLQVGMYVVLRLSWFKHPFWRKEFRIDSEKEIEIIQGLGLKWVSYDPELSDIQPPQTITRRAAQTVPAPSAPSAYDEVLAATRQKSILFLKEKQDKLKQCNREYHNSLGQVASITKEVSIGGEAGVDKAKELVEEVVATLKGNAESMVHLINIKEMDKVAYFHALNVCILSLILGRDLGLDEEELARIGLGALFHDIGKLKISKKVLLKKPPLSRSEWQYICMHPAYGYQMLENIPNFPEPALEIVFQHHERLTGKGYPQGLRGDKIHPYAQITAVADLYDNLCNPPHGDRVLTPHEAVSALYNCYREQLSSDILDAFIRAVGVYPPGTLVELSDGRLGMVIGVDKQKPLKPTVLLCSDDPNLDGPLVEDMAEDDQYHIQRTMHPRDLSPKEMEYLRPERMVGFFIHPKS
jgi:HD-GYP domain-containing protein (c-di-GMP phosphodiesterase class II)